jgi:hypothetical protein
MRVTIGWVSRRQRAMCWSAHRRGGDAQLQFGQALTKAAVRAKAEGEMAARTVLPSNSTSHVAVRRICAIGVCQRMISGTMPGTSSGLARRLSYSSGNSFRA